MSRQLSLYPLRVIVEDEDGKRYNLNCEAGPHTLDWNIRESLAEVLGLFWVRIDYSSEVRYGEAGG